MNKVYSRVLDFTTELLREHSGIPNRTVVFDFDDTLVNTRDSFSAQVPGVGNIEFYKEIPEMMELMRRAKVMGYNIFIITARPPTTEFIVTSNLKSIVPQKTIQCIDNIFASPIPLSGDIEKFRKFKTVLRKNLQKIDTKSACTINSWQLYTLDLVKEFPKKDRLNIILTIGDQPHDIANMSNYGILLPRPERNPDTAYLHQKCYLRLGTDHDICLQAI